MSKKIKRSLAFFMVVLIVIFSGALFSENLDVIKVGQWGSGNYKDVFVKGNYAFCAAYEPGLVILDISNSKSPQLVSVCKTPGDARGVFVCGNYAYVADGPKGLQLIDVSTLSNPSLKGYHYTQKDANTLAVSGNYAYVTDKESLYIIDIANPTTLIQMGYLKIGSNIKAISVSGNYAYIADNSTMKIIDITNPSSPVEIGNYTNAYLFEDIFISGNYAFVVYRNVVGLKTGFEVIDVSLPSAPTSVSIAEFESPTDIMNIHVVGNYAYLSVSCSYVTNTSSGQKTYLYVMNILDISKPTKVGSVSYSMGSPYPNNLFAVDNQIYMSTSQGLLVFDASNPTSPQLAGSYETSYGYDVEVKGNYAYLAGGIAGIIILNISNPACPSMAGKYNTDGLVKDIYLEGKYLYAADTEGLLILDVNNPTIPVLVTCYDEYGEVEDVFVSGNHVFFSTLIPSKLRILDNSDPTNPLEVGEYTPLMPIRDIFVKGDYAYLAENDYQGIGEVTILDVSNPATPSKISNYWSSPLSIYVANNFAYVAGYGGLKILDVSNPVSPSFVGSFYTSPSIDIYLNGKYIYTANREYGLQIIDVSTPSNPLYAANYDTTGFTSTVFADGDSIFLSDGNSGLFYILRLVDVSSVPRINTDRSLLNFTSFKDGTAAAQTFLVSNSGGGTLQWSASVDKPWLACSPSFGTGNGEINVSINTSGLSPGTHSGTVTVSDNAAINASVDVEVLLKIYSTEQKSVPFGIFSTPVDGSTVSSSVPFSGWVLDDIGVQSVQLFREYGHSLVYIGDAVFVEGARPDVEQAYPGYPNNHKAGWGYMLLTNFLPNGGNGTFNIHAIATDLEGNQITLGTKTIICDNANAVKPFGAIDTPAQGGTASGSDYVNFGWTLTPLPNTIPIDGSTLQVWVDGIPLGNPVYNQYRKDIATLFPDYNNSNGAVGYFYLGTTKYENGVHTIAWSAEDDAGNKDGIGSRYFTIQNLAERTAQSAERSDNLARFHDLSKIPIDYSEPVDVIRGFNRNGVPLKSYPDGNGNITLEIRELERIEVRLFPVGTGGLAQQLSCIGFQVIGGQLRPLPIGSTLDRGRGVFYWQPGPGYLGKYHLVFVEEDKQQNKRQKQVWVTIRPKLSMIQERGLRL